MITERIAFPGATGHELAGRLDLPEDGAPKAYALFAHCFTCSKDFHVVREIGKQMTAEGIGLLRFDFTGLGQSGSDFTDTSFSTNLADLLAAAQFLRERYEPPAVLAGHSLGGAAVLAAAADIPEARCVATIGAPASVKFVRNLVPGLDRGDAESAEVSIGGRPFSIGRSFVDDLEKHDLAQDIAELGRPFMVFHSPRDQVVPLGHAQRIFETAKDPRSFVSLDEADHLCSAEEDGRFLGHVLSAWAHRYI